MDILYVLGNGSEWQNNELRYSLRSVAAYLGGFHNVVIVGDCPKWVRNVIHIPAGDPYRYNKEANICHKVLTGCHYTSSKFLFMNDDHIFLRTTNIHEIPVYFDGDLKDGPDGTTYYQCLLNTRRTLLERNLTTYNFDVHVPTPILGQPFTRIMDSFDWRKDLLINGLVVKSVYGNALRSEGTPISDLKLKSPLPTEHIGSVLEGRWAFSFGDTALNRDLKRYLHKLFPNPSIFEEAS